MKNLLYIITVLMAFGMVSCSMEAEEKITWDLQQHPEMLVVESIVTNEFKHQVIHLSKTNTYYDTSWPKGVGNATVEVSDGQTSYTFKELTDSVGWYTSEQPFAGKQRTTYQLNIQLATPINNITTYTAKSTLPEGLSMDSITCEIYKMPKLDLANDEEKKDTSVLVVYYFGNEPAEAENFYFVRTFCNGKLLYSNPKEYTYFSVARQNASYTHWADFEKNVGNNDSIRFQLFTISADYYHFLEAVQNIDDAGNSYSLSGPPANVVGNIEGGKALGYFLTAYFSEKKGYAINKR